MHSLRRRDPDRRKKQSVGVPVPLGARMLVAVLLQM